MKRLGFVVFIIALLAANAVLFFKEEIIIELKRIGKQVNFKGLSTNIHDRDKRNNKLTGGKPL